MTATLEMTHDRLSARWSGSLMSSNTSLQRVRVAERPKSASDEIENALDQSMAEDRNLFPRANSDQAGGNFLLRQTN